MVDTTLSCAPLLQMLMSYASATYLLKNIRYFLSSADSHYKKDREVKVQHYVNSIKCMPQPAGVRLISVPRSAHFAVGTGHRVCSIRQRRSCCLFITRVILINLGSWKLRQSSSLALLVAQYTFFVETQLLHI
ncbi:uncharacterized protein LOC107872916 isoform X5 [Capsicum annuum]|uniref:uncharacterized protein LOC107872916 isoform X5 n=1 Tax=Capsicum annuum TaxID=4072 RepID=UPI001FB0FF0F|nr:uncharacterized protein LOC107872916 isoform X5 [Capsicum annuum]